MNELLLAALMAWTGIGQPELQPWADAMADVCVSKEECVTLAAQAFVESRFADYVRDERCNSYEWRHAQRGWLRKACDGGLAWGPWQMHDSRLQGASPELHASVALETMRHHPELWTTWKAAKSHAAWWLRQIH